MIGHIVSPSTCQCQDPEAMLELIDKKLMDVGKQALIAYKFDLQRKFTVTDLMFFFAYYRGLGGLCADSAVEDVCSNILTFLNK